MSDNNSLPPGIIDHGSRLPSNEHRGVIPTGGPPSRLAQEAQMSAEGAIQHPERGLGGSRWARTDSPENAPREPAATRAYEINPAQAFAVDTQRLPPQGPARPGRRRNRHGRGQEAAQGQPSRNLPQQAPLALGLTAPMIAKIGKRTSAMFDSTTSPCQNCLKASRDIASAKASVGRFHESPEELIQVCYRVMSKNIVLAATGIDGPEEKCESCAKVTLERNQAVQIRDLFDDAYSRKGNYKELPQALVTKIDQYEDIEEDEVESSANVTTEEGTIAEESVEKELIVPEKVVTTSQEDREQEEVIVTTDEVTMVQENREEEAIVPADEVTIADKSIEEGLVAPEEETTIGQEKTEEEEAIVPTEEVTISEENVVDEDDDYADVIIPAGNVTIAQGNEPYDHMARRKSTCSFWSMALMFALGILASFGILETIHESVTPPRFQHGTGMITKVCFKEENRTLIPIFCPWEWVAEETNVPTLEEILQNLYGDNNETNDEDKWGANEPLFWDNFGEVKSALPLVAVTMAFYSSHLPKAVAEPFRAAVIVGGLSWVVAYNYAMVMS